MGFEETTATPLRAPDSYLCRARSTASDNTTPHPSRYEESRGRLDPLYRARNNGCHPHTDVHHIIYQPTHHRLSQQDNPGRMLHPGRLLQTLRAVLQLLNVLTGFHDRHPTWFPLGETLPQLPQDATPGTQFRLKNLWEVPNNTTNTNKTSNTPYIYVYIIW